MATEFQCAHCGSDNTQKLSVVVALATTESTTETKGVGVAGNRYSGLTLAGGLAHSTTQSVTELGRHLAPPTEPTPSVWLTVAGMIGGFALASVNDASGWWYLINPIVGAVVGTLVSERINRDRHKISLARYREAREQWNSSYFCHRCGTVFTPGAVGRESVKFVEDSRERDSQNSPRVAARVVQPSLAIRGAAWGLRKQVESGALSREDALKSLMELRSRGTYVTREEAEDVLGDVGRDDSKPKSDTSDGSGSDQ